MKILVDLSYYFPHISGLSEYARRLAEGLNSVETQVEVICNKQNASSLENEIIAGVKIRRFQPIMRLNKISFSLKLVVWCIQNMGRYDVVIIHLPNPEGMMVALLARIMGKKIVSVLHCDVAIGKSILEKIISFISKVSNVVSAIVSNRVVVNSLDYASSIKYLRFFTNKLTEIFPIVGLPTIKLKSKVNKRGKITLGYLGRISEEKNLHTVIQAIKKVGRYDVCFELAGPNRIPGEENYFLKVDRMVQQSNGRVIINGKLNNQEVKLFLKKIDFFVLASNVSTESFGIVQVEAMRFGIPVIVSNMPGVRVPVLLTGAGVLVNDYNDPDDWARKIEMALDNEDKLKKLTVLSEKIFDPNKELEKWRELIRSI